MNENLISEIAGKTGLIKSEDNLVTGSFNGYLTIIKLLPKIGFADIAINGTAAPEQDGKIQSFIESLKQSFGNAFACNYKNNAVNCLVKIDDDLPGNLHMLLNKITDFYKDEGILSGCSECGKTDIPVSLYKIGNQNKFTCDSCFTVLKANTQQPLPNSLSADAADSGKENILLGIIGALLGASVSLILWLLVAKLGYIAGLCGIVMFFCTFWGYSKFSGGKQFSSAGLIICIVIMAVMVYLATRLSWAIRLTDALEGKLSLSSAFFNLPLWIDIADAKASFYKDLVVAYVLTFASCGSMFIKSFKGK